MIFDVSPMPIASLVTRSLPSAPFLKHAESGRPAVGRQPLGSTGCTVIVGEAAPKTKESVRLEEPPPFIDVSTWWRARN